MSSFPPQNVYPIALDSDYTLLLVHNTSEAMITSDNEPWADEINVKPVSADKREIWADNGFATIEGELFYYDAVGKDSNGKVHVLKRCARSLGGDPTKRNFTGTMVRGFVVAEHHNMLVDGIVNTEKFIGYNFTTDQETLDWRIRNLKEIPIIFDDFGCPDVNFTFNIVSSNASSGTLTKYKIQTTGNFTQFTLSFGDGTSTTSLEEGTHTYAPNSIIDPVVTFANERCTVVQTAIERTNSSQPEAELVNQSFIIPTLPNLVFPNISIPQLLQFDPDITLPPILFPHIDIPDFGISTGDVGISGINVPSMIIFEPLLDIPSFIDFGPINIPSLIVTLDDIPISFPIIDDIPTSIVVNIPNIPNIPSIITIIDDLPLSLAINFPNVSLAINFPNVSIAINFPNVSIAVIDDIPSNILLLDDLPFSITVKDDIPSEISVIDDIPSYIIVEDNLPEVIYVIDDICCSIAVYDDIPYSIIVYDDIPYSIVVYDDVPDNIYVYDDIPTNIFVIDDIPPSLIVLDDIPTNISVTFPAVPTIPVSWGTPPTIPVVVTVQCPSSTSMTMAGRGMAGAGMGIGDMTDNLFNSPEDIEVSYDISGFPSEIKLMAHESVPKEIMVRNLDIPETISLLVPEFPDIKIAIPDTPLQVEMVGLPDSIRFDVGDDFPHQIELTMPLDMPVMKLDFSDMPKSLSVTGIPETIKVEPIEIVLKAPEFIPLKYEGDAIPVNVKLELDMNKLLTENGEDHPCFAILPCKK
jgi:hypothetical protein